MPPKATPDKGEEHMEAKELSQALIVEQPPKLEYLLETLATIDKFSESIGEDRSKDLGASGGTSGVKGASGTGTSVRDQAIANIPSEPQMRKQLAKYIEKEVKVLRRKVRKSARRAAKPGAAHALNELYAQVRRLNALLSNLLELSYEIVKRLFIRVFIDKQPIL